MLRCFETLKKVGVISRVQVNAHDECVTKAIHPARELMWTDQSINLEIEDPGVPVDPADQTMLEVEGTVDIQSMIKTKKYTTKCRRHDQCFAQIFAEGDQNSANLQRQRAEDRG